MKATIEMTPNGYGFGYDWTLVLPPTKKWGVQRFFMGQDAKVCARLLGMTPKEVCAEVVARANMPERVVYPYEGRAAQALASLIIEAFGGIRQVRKAEAWDLHAGGG